MSAADEPGTWVEIQPGVWANPATGGRSTPQPCGWCGRRIVWPVEGFGHSWGRCIDPDEAAVREADATRGRRPRRPSVPEVPPDVPSIVISIVWPSTRSGSQIRELARALGTGLSLKYRDAAVNVRTLGTARGPGDEQAGA